MIVCVGIPASFPFFSAVAAELGAETLVSANALRKKTVFRTDCETLFQRGWPRLDSAGFVAMKRYGGYPWSRRAYVELAAAHPWVWWASRDFCCEPEIASNRAEVLDRVRRTAEELKLCRIEAEFCGAPDPMPVLQGWEPDDYARCADMVRDLPPLVGVGSVCRRVVKGLVEVVERLDRTLPQGVHLHLFGVKSAGVRALVGHPRVHSVDSMAWDFRAAQVAMRRRKTDPDFSCDLNFRAGFMREWYQKQITGMVDVIFG